MCDAKEIHIARSIGEADMRLNFGSFLRWRRSSHRRPCNTAKNYCEVEAIADES